MESISLNWIRIEAAKQHIQVRTSKSSVAGIEMCFMNHLLWMNTLAGGCPFLNVWKYTVMTEVILRSAKKTLLFKLIPWLTTW